MAEKKPKSDRELITEAVLKATRERLDSQTPGELLQTLEMAERFEFPGDRPGGESMPSRRINRPLIPRQDFESGYQYGGPVSEEAMGPQMVRGRPPGLPEEILKGAAGKAKAPEEEPPYWEKAFWEEMLEPRPRYPHPDWLTAMTPDEFRKGMKRRDIVSGLKKPGVRERSRKFPGKLDQ